MATLEDKLLGEKKEYYCSSSEDEAEASGDEGERSSAPLPTTSQPALDTDPGGSTNTGPKGVIKDWQKYRQLEAERREEQERERLTLIHKLSLTCRSALDEEREAEEDPEFAEFLSDAFLMEYSKNRMKEMLQKANDLPKFGHVIPLLTAHSFLEAVDAENKCVTVIVHIYEDKVEECKTMNECLNELAETHPEVKFCKIPASVAGVSRNFKVSAIPALLVYKSGNLVGNYIKLSEEFGKEFIPNDVENFLIENGMLIDKSFVPKIIQ